MTLGAARIRELLDLHGIRPSRALGQNFVADPNTVRRIVRLADVGPGDAVVEVGPGLGSLTGALLEAGAAVTAVEADPTLAGLLGEIVGPEVRVVHADAVTVDWTALLGADRPWTLVANLPYNVATPVVIGVLTRAPMVGRAVVMVQREVGERWAAPAGSRLAGLPTVKIGYHAAARIVGRVPPTVFIPRPKVASVLVELRRHDRPPTPAPYEEVVAVAARAYRQRRKMLRRSLPPVMDEAAIAAAGVDPTARPEQLSVADWGALALGAGR